MFCAVVPATSGTSRTEILTALMKHGAAFAARKARPPLEPIASR
jgi:hypothetical protein